MSDPAAVDTALAALLSSDAALTALCPGGVFYAVAPQDAEGGVVVYILEDHQTQPMFGGGSAWEEFTYTVQAVIPGTAGEPTRDANARIADLLRTWPTRPADQPAGYVVAYVVQRYDRPAPELDTVNLDNRWQIRGGHYLVTAQPSA